MGVGLIRGKIKAENILKMIQPLLFPHRTCTFKAFYIHLICEYLKDKPKHFKQILMISRMIVGMTINTSNTSQPSTKQHILTKVHIKCTFMVQFSKLNIHQNAGTLLEISRLGSGLNLGVENHNFGYCEW